jgi:hypothetical protein
MANGVGDALMSPGNASQPSLSDFLGAFFSDCHEPVWLRAFAPKAAPAGHLYSAEKIRVTRASLLQSKSRLVGLNESRGLYFVVNAGGNNDNSITRFNAVFCEADVLSIAEQHRRLDAAPLRTSIRLETVKSAHAYWLLQPGCTEHQWRRIQAGLLSRFGGDVKIKNPSRVMRLPYFNHVSLNGDGGLHFKRVELVQFEPERRYTAEELLEAFPMQCQEEKSDQRAAGTFSSWDELNSELRRRIASHPTATKRPDGWIHCKGLCHGGKSDSAIALNPATGAYHCQAGCEAGTILRAFGLPERPNQLPEVEVQSKQCDTFVETWLTDSGLFKLSIPLDVTALEKVLAWIHEHVTELVGFRGSLARAGLLEHLKTLKVPGAARIVDDVLPRESHREDDEGQQGRAIVFAEVIPTSEQVDGGRLLEDIEQHFSEHAVLPPGAAVTAALWTVHTYARDAAFCSPILGITSPEKRCGKTLVLELTQAVCNRAVMAANISAAALFRAVEKYCPTLLVDEADTFLAEHEELRGIFNCGHRRSSAYVVRCAGENLEPRIFSVWSPKAIAAIGQLPGTIEDRSLVIRMRRQLPGESTKRFDLEKAEPELQQIRSRCARWAKDHISQLKDIDPLERSFLNDRQRDSWRPLFAIADAAGGDWPRKATEAARLLSGGGDEETSNRIQLLADLRDLFERNETDRLSSAAIIENLAKMEERPWPEWRNGKPMTTRQLAALLKPFDIKPDTIRIGMETPKGYMLEWFADAFSRYLNSQSATSATTLTSKDFG